MATVRGEDPGRAAGNRFPMALRGYEASAVDAHIDSLERKLAALLDQSQGIGDRIARLEDELLAAAARVDGAAEPSLNDPDEHEVRRLEAMAQSIIAVLHSAHEEAAAVRERAEAEAQAILREAVNRLADADRRVRKATAGVKGSEPTGATSVEPAP